MSIFIISIRICCRENYWGIKKTKTNLPLNELYFSYLSNQHHDDQYHKNIFLLRYCNLLHCCNLQDNLTLKKDKCMSNSNQSRKICKLIKYYQNNQSLDFLDCKYTILLYDYIVHFHCMKDFHLGMIYLVRKRAMSYIFIL